MKVMMVGDLVGATGRKAFADVVARYKAAGKADVVVVNAENAAGGKGLTGTLAEELFKAGADAVTLGDHTWDQKELAAYLPHEKRVLRPANFAPACPGHGMVGFETDWGRVTVVNLVGRVFMNPVDCPFRTVDALLRAGAALGRVVLVDMHAEATSEKIVMGRYLDGRVTAVVGTHTHVQTSDEQVLPGGTAYITDLGMTGPKHSALGRDLESVKDMFVSGMPARFKLGREGAKLEGALIDVDRETGKAFGIQRIREEL